MKRWMIFMLALVSPVIDTFAQCAMCRATLENNLSNGKMGIAAGINTGILYLFFAPYLAIGVIAFFWYKTSKKNAKQLKRTLAG
jgi:hypothetical protein